ncbi:hypothetical protein OROMI_033228 [Orobanche minor]
MSSSNHAPPRKSKGRQKVTMVKMSNESNLQVTFSKRRSGLFKKASELCTLCGCEAAIVVFSPADKVFCFGHPNVQTVIDMFEHLNFPQQAPAANNNVRSQLIVEAHRNSTIRELNLELTQAESMLRVEKRRAEELDLLKKSGQMHGWFFGSLDGFTSGQLRVLKESIMDFKNNLDVKVQNDMFTLVNPHPSNFIYPDDHAGNKGNPRGFYHDGNYNNAQFSLIGSNNYFDPNFYHGVSDSNKGIINYCSINQALLHDDPMSSNIVANDGLVPSDSYHDAGGNNITDFVSSDQGLNMAFDPRMF